MSFIDLFWAADWDGLYRSFAKGNPPLVLQLLAVNTIFFILYVVRRITTKHRLRSTTPEVVQSLLVIVNLIVVFQEDALRWIEPHLSRLNNLI